MAVPSESQSGPPSPTALTSAKLWHQACGPSMDHARGRARDSPGPRWHHQATLQATSSGRLVLENSGLSKPVAKGFLFLTVKWVPGHRVCSSLRLDLLPNLAQLVSSVEKCSFFTVASVDAPDLAWNSANPVPIFPSPSTSSCGQERPVLLAPPADHKQAANTG